MALSGKVYSKGEFAVGIKNKDAEDFETAGANDTAYVLLPVTDVTYPTLNLVESGEMKSNNAGMIELKTDQFRTAKGGTITMDFEMPAERALLTRLLANVLQDHSQGSASDYIHTIEASSGNPLARPDLSSSASASGSDEIPSLFDIGIYYPDSAQDKIITSAVLSSLTINFDQGDGRCIVSGSFFSGFASSTGFKLEQTLSANSGKPTLASSAPTPIEAYFNTATLDVDGGANKELKLTGVSFTFENNVARVGRDGNGDAEAYSWGVPGVNITGELSFLMDANFQFTDGENILQDFLDGDTATLSLKQGDGTVSGAGEMNITAEIYSTAVNLDPNAETGAVITIPFKVVQPTASGLASGDAFKFVFHDGGIQASAW